MSLKRLRRIIPEVAGQFTHLHLLAFLTLPLITWWELNGWFLASVRISVFVKRLTAVLPTFICDVMYVEEICEMKKKSVLSFNLVLPPSPPPSPLSQLKFYIADSANIDQ